jgi:hypothetical protein
LDVTAEIRIPDIPALASKPLSDWRQADVYGGFYCGKNDYAAFWTTLQRLLPRWKGKEYGLPARPGVFLVYSSRGIVNSRG